jgi:hypothetical protein
VVTRVRSRTCSPTTTKVPMGHPCSRLCQVQRGSRRNVRTSERADAWLAGAGLRPRCGPGRFAARDGLGGGLQRARQDLELHEPVRVRRIEASGRFAPMRCGGCGELIEGPRSTHMARPGDRSARPCALPRDRQRRVCPAGNNTRLIRRSLTLTTRRPPTRTYHAILRYRSTRDRRTIHDRGQRPRDGLRLDDFGRFGSGRSRATLRRRRVAYGALLSNG